MDLVTPAELAEHQADAESMMTLTLEAYEPNGTTTDADGYEVPAYTLMPFTAEVDGTPGKVQAGSQAGGDTNVRYLRIGDVQRPVLTGGLHIPISAPVPAAGEQRGNGWEYLVVGVGPGDDPELLGRRYLVVESPAKSRATARRLDVVEI